MGRRPKPLFLTFVRDLPRRETIIGGERVRPVELVDVLAEHGVDGEVWCVSATEPRSVGSVRIRQLPLPAWAPAREALAVPVTLLILLVRVAQYRRVVLFQRVAGGLALRGRLPFISEPGWLFMGLARALGAKTWASMHDLSPEHEVQGLERALRSGIDLPTAEQQRIRRQAAINDRVQRFALRRATVTTVVSESLRREIRTRYGVDDATVHVVRAGINPSMFTGLTPWTPPAGRRWTVAYVGSRYDLQLGTLLEAVGTMQDGVELLLAGHGMDEVGATQSVPCRVTDARYADFTELANEVDIWAVPLADDLYLQWSWHLKLPMNLATGRPVILTEIDELQHSGLAHHFFVAEPSASGIQAQLRAIIGDPLGAQRKATAAQAAAFESMTWRHQFDGVLRALGLVA